jgi:hypothetical protein
MAKEEKKKKTAIAMDENTICRNEIAKVDIFQTKD